MQISINSVERANSPVYSAPPCRVVYWQWDWEAWAECDVNAAAAAVLGAAVSESTDDDVSTTQDVLTDHPADQQQVLST